MRSHYKFGGSDRCGWCGTCTPCGLWRLDSDSDSVTARHDLLLSRLLASVAVNLLVLQIFMNPLRATARRFSTMASMQTSCSPFTQAVVASMRKLYVVS